MTSLVEVGGVQLDGVARSRSRYRRAGLTAVATAAARLLGVVTTLVSVPLVLGHLGNEQFGLWITITSLLTLLSFTDLGLGNGLINAISGAHGRDDPVAARVFVSNAIALLFGLALVMTAVCLVLAITVPWPDVFNVATPQARNEASAGVVVLFAALVIGIPLGVTQRIQMGFQEGFWGSLCAALGSVLALVATIVAVQLHAGLAWFVASAAGAPLIAVLLNGIWLFGWQRPSLRPKMNDLAGSICRALLVTGSAFLILQAAGAIAFQSDALIVSRILGVAEVSEYAVPARIFLLLQVALALIVGPLWPAYGESLARGDISWIERALRRSLLFTFAASLPAATLLVLFAQPLIELWVGHTVHPSLTLLVGLGTWTVVASVSTALAMFLNGANLVWVQAGLAVVMSLANVALSIILTRTFGVSGVIWGSVIAQVTCVLIPLTLLSTRLLERLRTPSQTRNRLVEAV